MLTPCAAISTPTCASVILAKSSRSGRTVMPGNITSGLAYSLLTHSSPRVLPPSSGKKAM